MTEKDIEADFNEATAYAAQLNRWLTERDERIVALEAEVVLLRELEVLAREYEPIGKVLTALAVLRAKQGTLWGIFDVEQQRWWPRDFTSAKEAQAHYDRCRGPGSRGEVRLRTLETKR